MKIKRALLSVWDKKNIEKLGKFLYKQKIEILSTGGTQKKLEDAGIKVRSIGDVTGGGSIMDGRVKTLHPKLFGGILADRNNSHHLNDLKDINGLEIDLVVVNFYPFVNEAVKKKLDFKKAIEFIDVGGPSMIRSAAKNFHSVMPLCLPEQYDEFINVFISNNGDIPIEYRQKSAASVFAITSGYETAIYNYFNKEQTNFPELLALNLKKVQNLRYGENPHQKGAFYIHDGESLNWNQYQGKKLSFNNYSDMEFAYKISSDFSKNACTIIKHANPCGFALGNSPKEAFHNAIKVDPISYFGGIVGFNKQVDKDVSEELIKPFLECIIAPSFSDEALQILANKKNLRLIYIEPNQLENKYCIKSAAGGYLYQEKDISNNELDKLRIVTKKKPNKAEYDAFKIGWRLVQYVKSNAIVFSNKTQLLGVGAGQMSRIDSVKIAIQKVSENGLNLKGAIMASDAFFPFSDCVELAAKVGISAIIQPGGSIKDKEIIEKADELDIAMVLTDKRHFFH